MLSAEAKEVFYSLTPKQRLRAQVRHYNGTCKCYVAPGEGINGTQSSGKHCLVACLPVGHPNKTIEQLRRELA